MTQEAWACSGFWRHCLQMLGPPTVAHQGMRTTLEFANSIFQEEATQTFPNRQIRYPSWKGVDKILLDTCIRIAI